MALGQAEGEKAGGASNRILAKMLERLFALLVNGPGLNCRPHSSRQRVDVSQVSRMQDVSGEDVLRALLGEERRVKVTSRAVQPKKRVVEESVELSEAERRVQRQWTEQTGFMAKLRTIAEDARTYEQDTGVHVLNVGFPLLSVPPGAGAQRGRGGSRRIVAPVAFIPVTLEVRSGGAPGVEIRCKGEGVDLVRPNVALLAWLESQTGKKSPAILEEAESENPWKEICDLVKHAAVSMGLTVPEAFTRDDGLGEGFVLAAAPRAEEETEAGSIVCSAVMGLYPMANEGLLRDMQAMAGGETLSGPVESFLNVDVLLGGEVEEHPEVAEEAERAELREKGRRFGEERLVTDADPCQARAVRLARESAGLVIHGPPGTGKSQTITNIIGDHLARGQRVLMVCDKRTALDVVAHRLDHLGFGPLVALVHDAQRDQRDLYRALRERLEGLAEVRTRPGALRELEKADAELQHLHGELTAYWKALMTAAAPGDASLHDLMGRWLAIEDQPGLRVEGEPLRDVRLEEGLGRVRILREILERGLACNYAENPWVGAVGMPLGAFLSKPVDAVVDQLKRCLDSAEKARVAVDENAPALGEGNMQSEGALRLEVAEALENLLSLEAGNVLEHWANQKTEMLVRSAGALADHERFIEILRTGRMEKELLLAVKGKLPTIAEMTSGLGALEEYLEVARKWWGFLSMGRKSRARAVLTPLGMRVSAENGERAKTFLTGLRARVALRDVMAELMKQDTGNGVKEAADLEREWQAHRGAIELLLKLRRDRAHAGLAKLVEGVFLNTDTGAERVAALRKSAARAAAIAELERNLLATAIFAADWLAKFSRDVRSGQDPVEVLEALMCQARSLEHVVRVRDALTEMPGGLQTAVQQVLKAQSSVEAGMAALEKAFLATEIGRRLGGDAVLQHMDGQRLKSSFDRYRELEDARKTLVRDAALDLWVTRQKSRLLASTGTRISSLGADLRRRLTLRGERAMRLRQVVENGSEIDGGDPLFDMCPVWMASPETVAQIFPRRALFDVVVFDEASQCRLEEALPVLTRGNRVVIAGDPKQLPPTRFFESAIVASDEDEAQTEQGLFESQQGEVEDLLTAALNLSIENAYLDVHYRSRNSDLIQFSNTQFYGSRLQAIPGHPKNMTRFSPLTLYRVDGVYADRQNVSEAERVCGIVRDLLKRAEPPSIGIACFNLQQRDLIVEKLDDLAMEDADFSKRLAEARVRRGAGSFEGLFVKNLENVQGDERDHMIISTTYGPDENGRFYQRFGPLGRVGGGRRLNVLVTRARSEVHLVTSIPPSMYRQLPPVPAGQTPGGAWLLYAYLHYAEQLSGLYATQADEEPVLHSHGSGQVLINGHGAQAMPSLFAESLAKRLAATLGHGSIVHWGNEGFCVDVAMLHPQRHEDVTIGVLCDGSRFLQAADPVEWDVFRTRVHESQGWELHRIWSPQFFRDASGHLADLKRALENHLLNEKPADALGVVPEP